jgi:hypothetical protein
MRVPAPSDQPMRFYSASNEGPKSIDGNNDFTKSLEDIWWSIKNFDGWKSGSIPSDADIEIVLKSIQQMLALFQKLGVSGCPDPNMNPNAYKIYQQLSQTPPGMTRNLLQMCQNPTAEEIAKIRSDYTDWGMDMFGYKLYKLVDASFSSIFDDQGKDSVRLDFQTLYKDLNIYESNPTDKLLSRVVQDILDLQQDLTDPTTNITDGYLVLIRNFFNSPTDASNPNSTLAALCQKVVDAGSDPTKKAAALSDSKNAMGSLHETQDGNFRLLLYNVYNKEYGSSP